MIDKLKRFREPAAFVFLGAVVVQIIVAVVQLPIRADTYSTTTSRGGLGIAAQNVLTQYLQHPGLVVAAAILVGSCVLMTERTAHDRLLVVISLIIFGVLTLESLVLAILGLTSGLNFLDLINTVMLLLVPAGSAVLMLLVVLNLPAPAGRQAPGYGYGPPGYQAGMQPPSGPGGAYPQQPAPYPPHASPEPGYPSPGPQPGQPFGGPPPQSQAPAGPPPGNPSFGGPPQPGQGPPPGSPPSGPPSQPGQPFGGPQEPVQPPDTPPPPPGQQPSSAGQGPPPEAPSPGPSPTSGADTGETTQIRPTADQPPAGETESDPAGYPFGPAEQSGERDDS